MTNNDIIRMARECGIPSDELYHPNLERFAALVAAAEREKSLQLWLLLDDIDTADDIAKENHAFYRSLCRKTHKARWEVLNETEVDAALKARSNI